MTETEKIEKLKKPINEIAEFYGEPNEEQTRREFI